MLSVKYSSSILPARNALAILVPTSGRSLISLLSHPSRFCFWTASTLLSAQIKKGNVLAISGSRSTKVSHFLRRYTSPLCSFAREIPTSVQLLRHLTEIAPCNNEVKETTYCMRGWLTSRASFKMDGRAPTVQQRRSDTNGRTSSRSAEPKIQEQVAFGARKSQLTNQSLFPLPPS